ncbi:STAS domain-containing protein [Planosporangium thailandense]|uniref:Anti-sigma factor antagonist n=1 Tax=Planosporangium thailandense TaxID=765197 RepID=A0ABX0XZJ4_9ACTN|nr:STAS domain-containing protein [Planosporangium thailandense]NJC71208.1 STAS domain-containing protein [Planosporangium thailandense]
MTALPTRDREGIDLVCDSCGHRLPAISSRLRHWDVVWTLVSRHGWTGSPLAIGPHRCPQCTAVESSTPDDAAATAQVPPLPWSASVKALGDAAIVELSGDLDLLTAARLRAVVTQTCAGHRHVVIDLANVRLIDSTALGILVRAHQTARSKGGHLCLAAPSQFIIAVLQTMRLQPVFPIFAGSEQAMDWIAAGCP